MFLSTDCSQILKTVHTYTIRETSNLWNNINWRSAVQHHLQKPSITYNNYFTATGFDEGKLTV